MTKLQILKSDREGKKFKAVFTKDDGKTKTVHFGASGYQDYTQHKNLDRRRLYRQRHEKDLKGDPMRAGYLSYYILWGNSTNLQANIRSFKNKFGFT
jgi:hypothetical protein